MSTALKQAHDGNGVDISAVRSWRLHNRGNDRPPGAVSAVGHGRPSRPCREGRRALRSREACHMIFLTPGIVRTAAASSQQAGTARRNRTPNSAIAGAVTSRSISARPTRIAG